MWDHHTSHTDIETCTDYQRKYTFLLIHCGALLRFKGHLLSFFTFYFWTLLVSYLVELQKDFKTVTHFEIDKIVKYSLFFSKCIKDEF